MKSVDIDINKMIDLYVGQGLTAKACALKLNVSQSAFVRRLKKIGITIRPSIKSLIVAITDEQIADLYCSGKLSHRQIASQLDCSEGLVRGRLHKLGISPRPLSEGQKLGKGTAYITDKELIYLHDVRGWPCSRISNHFNKSADFVRQRFILIGKVRRGKTGKDNPAYIDGRTPLRTRIRDCAKSLLWKQVCMERDNYSCQDTGQHGGKLEVHHKKYFSQIFEEFLSLNSDLDPENDCDKLFDLSQEYNPFWDISNGITLSEKAHHALRIS